MEIASSLSDASRRALCNKGRLSTALPGYVPREAQLDLAEAIAKTLENKSILIAEAGTGTGKTFAYLVPCLLSGKKALISTATKTLQDQLFQKDLPILVRALGLAVRVQNLKGRANYICLHRAEQNAEEGNFSNVQCVADIRLVKEKIPQLTQGERAELPEIPEDSPVWPYVTSTADNCLGAQCPKVEECFLVKARKRAKDADIVVINHHLFFADSRLKKEGFAELLPGVDIVIFDEAHQLAEIAANFYGDRISTRQFRELLEDILKEWPVLDLANQPFKQLQRSAENIFDSMMMSLPDHKERVSWRDLRNNKVFMGLWKQWQALKEEIKTCLEEEQASTVPGLKRCKERLADMEQILTSFESGDEHIRWVERLKHSLVFQSTPYEFAKAFKLLIQQTSCAYVFTSATLTVGDSFECFSKPLGIEEAQTLLLASPFNYQQQAMLYLPRSLPDPKDAQYYPALVDKVLPLIHGFGGRCFFLFTSHKALKQVAQLLHNTLNYPLLIQGDEAKPILLARFREAGNAVLLGTATFWEGVDVKGEALSCVIIDKLPFASPNDPVIEGKMAYLKSRGLSGFDELSLPNAVIALKQGVGRLIRDLSDKGVLVIADPRLTAREYGRQILASLPKLPKTRDEQKILTFIKTLALENEPVSN